MITIYMHVWMTLHDTAYKSVNYLYEKIVDPRGQRGIK